MNRLFGTNGVRGVVNESLTSELACELAMAIGTYVGGGNAIIGTDTRTSNQMIKYAVMSGLLSTGMNIIDIGIAGTPVVQFATRHLAANHGVIITASHNPPQFNGIKCIDADGTELPRAKEEAIEFIYFSKKFKRVPWNKVGIYQKVDITNAYIEHLCKHLNVKDAGFKVVVDCGNGTGSFVTPYLLERLGCNVITLNAHPAGSFPGHPSEPTIENAETLMATVKALKADFGLIQDGDVDRTIFVDENGSYIYGDKTLALFAKYICRRNRGGVVVIPVSTSTCVEDVVVECGGSVIYTKVGSPTVTRMMMETKAVFGGEENGGLIFPESQYCRDGIMSAAKMVELLSVENKKLSELIKEIPQYALYKTKIHCPDEKKDVVLQRLVAESRGKRVDTTDGVKIYLDKGWVLVRPSGTEPIYRIFAEAKSPDDAKQMADTQIEIIKKYI